MSDPHFAAQQAATARWMGYPDAEAMNADHDKLHAVLCRWLNVTSHSLLAASGEPHDAAMAAIKEDAVLYLQRFIAHLGIGAP